MMEPDMIEGTLSPETTHCFKGFRDGRYDGL
jgi:hypothetical protein